MAVLLLLRRNHLVIKIFITLNLLAQKTKKLIVND